MINSSLNYIPQLSSDKFSSGVLEKFIEHGGKIYLDHFIEEVLKEDTFISVINSATGVYIFKKAFQYAKKNQLMYLINEIDHLLELVDNEINYNKMLSLINYYSVGLGLSEKPGKTSASNKSKFSNKIKSNDYMENYYHHKQSKKNSNNGSGNNYNQEYTIASDKLSPKFNKYAQKYTPKAKNASINNSESLYDISYNQNSSFNNNSYGNQKAHHNENMKYDSYFGYDNYQLGPTKGKNQKGDYQFKRTKKSRFFDNLEGEYKK